MSERIWYQDLKGFITEKNYMKFFPNKDMNFIEQLNSLLRFAIYFSILIFIFKKDANIFFIIIAVAGFTYMIHMVDTQNKNREKFYLKKKNLEQDKISNKLCVKPTKSNPFMNVLMTDLVDNPDRKPACNISNGKTKKIVKKYFDNNLYRDVSDIYDKNASDRNYYTTPITTIPNDQEAFAKYCWGHGKTCKERNGNRCYANMYRAINN